ncbi:MAG: FHA domain-containing protein [Deltaproteobacteria bacterium]|nr:FHA domain-containing protein [Deltaproteobacteria bacterium]
MSYTLDPKGAFLPLYEGLRNTVGIPAAWSATADQFLSPKPAVISCHQGEFVLEDRLSNHGIHVNGPEAIGAIRLENGNEIRLGGHVFILVAIPRG